MPFGFVFFQSREQLRLNSNKQIPRLPTPSTMWFGCRGVVKIEKLPESPTMLQGPSRGLCSAQTSGSPMTLNSAPAAGSASKADVNLECVETGQASGSAREARPLVLHAIPRQP